MKQALTYIELDIPICSLTYGTLPCAASIPATGARKCFNTIKTCQDADNFTDAEVTLRFAVDAEYLPREIDAIPSIKEIGFTPAIISLGENLGTRATMNVVFTDHPHSDAGAGFDKYLVDRPYDPFRSGTFWGKFRARQPYLRGQAIRLINGYVGQALSEMETRHYVVESFDGPTPDGRFSLVAKDILKLTDGDRAQAPAMSTGFLVAPITNVATTATLSPVGVGNAEYPAFGKVAIGGREIVSFTRAGDVLTITRAQNNTEAQAHNAQDRVQLVLSYAAADVADIIADLMVNYASISAGFIPLADWQTETDTFLGRLYTADICEPTSVAALISELIQQAALAVWWDDGSQKIRLQVLRGIVTDAMRFTPDNTIQGSLTAKDQPEKRISQVQVLFGRKNPLKQLSDTENYRSSSVTIDADAEEEYGSPVINKIYSRWIPALGRTVADRLGKIRLARFRDPPRRLTFDLSRYAGTDPELGGGYRVESHCFQDETGARVDVPVQVTKINPAADRYKVEAEEAIFGTADEDLSTRTVIVDSSIANVNLRAAHDAIYPPAASGDAVVCRVFAGVRVTSAGNLVPSFDVGSWPAGVDVTVILEGAVQGAGGRAGDGHIPGGNSGQTPGQPGGVALYTRYPIKLELPPGSKLWGGGGGGGGGASFGGNGGGGGGGAGDVPGLGGWGNTSGQPGTDAAGGLRGPPGPNGYAAGDGGGPGLPGNNGVGALGGIAGAQIDGVSFVTVTVTGGDRRGPTIN